jgi:hypothetical protein
MTITAWQFCFGHTEPAQNKSGNPNNFQRRQYNPTCRLFRYCWELRSNISIFAPSITTIDEFVVKEVVSADQVSFLGIKEAERVDLQRVV